MENLTDQTHLLIFREDSLTVNNLQNDKLDIGSINMDSSLLTTNIVDNLKDQDYNLLDDTNIISEVFIIYKLFKYLYIQYNYQMKII